VIALQREPGYELGLPEKIRARLKPEGGRAQRKLQQMKASIEGKGLLHDEEYPHPEACSITLTEMLTKVCAFRTAWDTESRPLMVVLGPKAADSPSSL
jgi:hypothetical protein